MTPKKIACFVEGQTEQIFVERLFQEIAGYKKISIETYKFQGSKDNRIIQSLKLSKVQDAPFFVLLYNCGCDSQVLSDIRKRHESLTNSGYEKILGLRDLYPDPLEKKQEIEKGIRGCLKPLQKKGIPISMNLAVMEIEAWFLAEWHYFYKLDNCLSPDFIRQNLGLDLINIDVEQRLHPSQDLDDIYHLIGSKYDKSEEISQNIINYLDYEFLYLELVSRVKQLKSFIGEIDSFLVE
ncbi:hypothetical protein D0A34_25040 [Microcoleus vaginatus PCC 9802]|uniref:hypothetical protein n=1 Tax=Microcoleus vaginatus TaxID=119532 RepID=UPI00020D27F7|nr:hypothetical protein MicvaDRAFT_3164 [Microcoleus vaginatus FGP-2]UNU21671.1 hypothetical protein D0A34_25040 [Microcoleus vaginatus PCC 9802]